jgi:hypothetical protein
MAQAMPGLLIAKGKSDISILPKMANRHGLVAGATGTGKTVTLRVLAEQFSKIGVPTFMADVKGDLSGLTFPGGENPKVVERIEKLGLKRFQTLRITCRLLRCVWRARPSSHNHLR